MDSLQKLCVSFDSNDSKDVPVLVIFFAGALDQSVGRHLVEGKGLDSLTIVFFADLGQKHETNLPVDFGYQQFDMQTQ